MSLFIDSEELDQLLDRLREDGVPIGKLLDLRHGVLNNDPALQQELQRLARQHGFWHPEGRS
jgi:hypothetical protein